MTKKDAIKNILKIKKALKVVNIIYHTWAENIDKKPKNFLCKYGFKVQP